MSSAFPAGAVLLADVGGTHVRFALADMARAQPLLDASIRACRVVDFTSFGEAARSYLDEIGVRPRNGVFAIAGPVEDDGVRMTNHAWTITRARVRAELGLASVWLINDFTAMACCIALLGERDMRVIGSPPVIAVDSAARQTFAVIGPGTGLGVGALLVRDGRRLALETEGGHVGFAPRDAEEIEVLRHLSARFGRVSNERLLCGSGLVNLYRALSAIHGRPDAELGPEDITRRAAEGKDSTCTRAVELFCDLLGAVAGDMALAFGAWEGVYLAGGMTPVLLPWLQRGGFRTRFEDKGRYAEVLGRVPTAAILHPQAGLLGAAAFAIDHPGD